MGLGPSVPQPEELSEEERSLPLKNNCTTKEIAKRIKNGSIKKIIVMTGAGISVSCGIPDFRSPDTGLYANLSKFNLDAPEDIFSIEFFRQNPKPFFALAKELYPGRFRPSTAHYFIRLLHEKGVLLRNYTQNVDNLERIAGIPSSALVEAHGSFASARCVECRTAHPVDWVRSQIFGDNLPSCQHTPCTGVVKPDIVFFGESLPEKYHNLNPQDFPVCDLLIVMGTSLSVSPFAGLISAVGPLCPRLLINREAVAVEESMTGGHFRFQLPDNYRDVGLLTDCDSGVRQLARELGWEKELDALIADEHAQLSAMGDSLMRIVHDQVVLPQPSTTPTVDATLEAIVNDLKEAEL
eukprot:GILJ01005342.1.p1 GENE.GILJ01005342.1~~GILJ01005342.1.p1  ORF type:complete len:353 (+),score=38.14 GILJ01005342.1:73-1131(+)